MTAHEREETARLAELERTLAETVATLSRLADEHAVVDTLYQYGHGINAKDRELWLDVFTDDAHWAARTETDAGWNDEARGREELSAWFDEHARKWPLGSEGHIMSSARVTLDGDRAEARTYYLTLRRVEGGPALRSTGLYEDVLVRCGDGKWRISERHCIGNISYAP